MQQTESNNRLSPLVDIALTSGATAATVMLSDRIEVDEALAGLCREPQCENFGQSLSCPPHVGGPSEFRKLQTLCKYAVVLKIDLPGRVLFSNERPQIMCLLHDVVSAVEQSAIQMGYEKSRAFAGSSCKKLFCSDHEQCLALSEKNTCRHPGSARPSMSGFGVNVAGMMESAGWSGQKAVQAVADDPEAMSWVAGLVLVG